MKRQDEVRKAHRGSFAVVLVVVLLACGVSVLFAQTGGGETGTPLSKIEKVRASIVYKNEVVAAGDKVFNGYYFADKYSGTDLRDELGYYSLYVGDGQWRLGNQYARLKAHFGIDDKWRRESSSRYKGRGIVVLDGKTVADFQLRPGEAPKEVSVDLRGATCFALTWRVMPYCWSRNCTRRTLKSPRSPMTRCQL